MLRVILAVVLAGLVVGCNQPASRVSTPPVVQLVVFTAPWCGPCHQKAPAIDSILTDAKGRVAKVVVDIDQQPGTAERYGVRSIPTYVIVVDGVEHSRSSEPSEIRRLLGL